MKAINHSLQVTRRARTADKNVASDIHLIFLLHCHHSQAELVWWVGNDHILYDYFNLSSFYKG
jgi:hypothetical protein